MEGMVVEETTGEVHSILESVTAIESETKRNKHEDVIYEDAATINALKCAQYLPEGYNYIIFNEKYENDTNFEVEFRCNISTQAEAKQWMEALSEKSYITWRIGKTHPDAGRYNVYKIEYRCRHKGANKPKEGSSRRSYNTQCPAWLTLTIKRYVKKSRAKHIEDNEAKENPCLVRLRNIHNHQVGSAEVLRLRDVSVHVKEKLRNLYRCGHTPLSAYQKLQTDAIIEYGDDYYRIAADRRFCPNKAYCYDLYYSEFKKPNRALEILTKNVSTIAEIVETSDVNETDIVCLDDLAAINELSEQIEVNNIEASGNVGDLRIANDIPIVMHDDTNHAIIFIEEQLNPEDSHSQQPVLSDKNEVEGIMTDLEGCLNDIYRRFTESPVSEEKLLAMQAFVNNYKENAKTEQSFIRATYNFARHNDTDTKQVKKRKSYPANRRTLAKEHLHVVINSKDMHSYTHS